MKKLAGFLMSIATALSLMACQGGASVQQVEQPHYYEIEEVLALNGGEIAALLEQDGFTYDSSYHYNTANTNMVNKEGTDTGSGWVGSPSDNLIDEECFVQLYDENGNELSNTKAEGLEQITRMRISWHDCSVDDAEATAEQIADACGLSGYAGGGWFLGLKDGVWSSLGKSTINDVEGSWEIRIVTGKVGEGSSPMIMVEWTPFTAEWTESDFTEGLQLYSK